MHSKMATTADKVPTGIAHPSTSIGEAASKRHWVDHAARTTAVLAVLAAVSSGQYANQFSRTILAQAEATDQWNYYQAKSLKRHIVSGQTDLLKALALTQPSMAPELDKLQSTDGELLKKYDKEMAELKSKAENTEQARKLHERQGNWFQGAFIVLQAGVVLCTIAASSRQKALWLLAIVLGVVGLAVVGVGFLIDLGVV
jgi:hypothetical protein